MTLGKIMPPLEEELELDEVIPPDEELLLELEDDEPDDELLDDPDEDELDEEVVLVLEIPLLELLEVGVHVTVVCVIGELLLDEIGSEVEETTSDMLCIKLLQGVSSGTLYPTLKSCSCPLNILDELQITLEGVAKQFGSEIDELKIRPGGIGSVTRTFCAGAGPRLFTKIVDPNVPPGTTVVGADFVIDRSALCVQMIEVETV